MAADRTLGVFPPEWLDEMRARLDIVQVVSQYVALTQKGSKHWGLCPFHGEKTPSFSVDGAKQFYYCFGCHKGGDAIGFVRDLERLEFREAVELLAEQARLPLPEARDDEQSKRKRRVLEAGAAAAAFYYRQLQSAAGRAAREYLARRGVTEAAIRMFGIGATPDGWDGLTRHLTGMGFTAEELLRAGLCGQKDGRIYDLFRQRVMFPIISAQDKVIGFGGRALGDVQPKYLNSPDTPAFNKRQGLYALNLVKKHRDLTHLTLVEGYMDVVALTQAGVRGVVATLGTALTQEQGKLIRRYAGAVHLAYDGDRAGQKAILRALDICAELGLPAKVLDFPDGMDPDDFVRARGAAGLEGLEALEAPAYRMRRAADGRDLAQEADRMAYAVDCARILRAVNSAVEREVYLRKLSEETGFSREVLAEQIGQRAKQVHVPPTPPPAAARAPVDAVEKAQRWLLALLATGRADKQQIPADVFTLPLYREAAEALMAGRRVADIIAEVQDDASRAELAAAFQEEMPETDDQIVRMTADCMAHLEAARLREDIARVRRQMQGAEGAQKQACLQALQRLMAQEQRLRNRP